jgi:membrane-associated phospholipid phosphatase
MAVSDQADVVSDLLAFPLIGYSMLDGPVTAGWAGRNGETAVQLALINAQTFAVTEFLNLSISNALPRSRPEGAVCDPKSKYDPHCVKSFWSGHAANVFAAASLVCAEHTALDLYGGRADTGACATALFAATSVGALRIAGNDHHASDIVVGAVVGGLTGYLMPNLLHFRHGRAQYGGGTFMPTVGPAGAGLAFLKRW